MTMKHLRGTGRTTRMVEAALSLSADGRAVYLVAATAEDAARIRRLVSDKADLRPHGIKVETWDSLGPVNERDGFRPRGMHPNCVVLVDHHAIESRYGAVIEMLHRFDRPAAEAVPTNWLDPLLTGPSKVIGDPPYNGKDIEALLDAIREHMR